MTTRKDFLIASSLATLLPAPSLTAIAASEQIPTFQFDHARFKQIISRPAAHKHVFAAASVGRGSVLAAMYNTFYTYKNSLNTPLSRVLEIGVLYHGMAVTLALSDQAWSNSILPALPKLAPDLSADVQTLTLAAGNPTLRTGPTGVLAQSFEALVSSGAEFFVCNSALAGLSIVIGQALTRSSGDVYAELSHSLARGATLVPTGVWAVHALQEAHFTYLQTSL